jgi:2-polyprenyl-6-methoxyphenol hydroxylase-like FAD-dependent oxidoreductase
VVFLHPAAAELERIAARHDLLVVATGAKSLTELFPPVPERSPYGQPQRLLMAGLFRGIQQAEPLGLTYCVAPGAGEIFQAPFYSLEGRGASLLFEAVPGGPLEPAARMRYEDDPRAFEATVLALLRDHAPAVFERVEPTAFALTRPLDLLQGAVTPVVRRAWIPVGAGKYAVAVGDSWILNDPVVGQGANLGSHCAWVLAGQIRRATRFDEAFCRAAEDRMWELAGPVTEWTNAMLRPPARHAIGLLVAGSRSRAVADALVEGFNRPDEQWARFSSPDGAARFLDQFGMALPDVLAVASA